VNEPTGMSFSRQSDRERFLCQTLCSELLHFSYTPWSESVSQLGFAPKQDGTFGTLKRPACPIIRFLLRTADLRSRAKLPHSQRKPLKLHLQEQHGMVEPLALRYWQSSISSDADSGALGSPWVRSHLQVIWLCAGQTALNREFLVEAG